MTEIHWRRVHHDSTHELSLGADGAAYMAKAQITRWTMEELGEGVANAVILSEMGLEVLAQVLALKDNLDAMAIINLERPPSQPNHKRVFGGGRGGTWVVWIFGRSARFSARGFVGNEDRSFVRLLEDGLPEGFEEVCGAEVASKIIEAARELSPLECMCGTGCETPDQHGDLRRLSSARDPRAPYDVTAAVLRCEVCERWWTFDERGDSHYGYQQSLTQFIPSFE